MVVIDTSDKGGGEEFTSGAAEFRKRVTQGRGDAALQSNLGLDWVYEA